MRSRCAARDGVNVGTVRVGCDDTLLAAVPRPCIADEQVALARDVSADLLCKASTKRPTRAKAGEPMIRCLC